MIASWSGYFSKFVFVIVVLLVFSFIVTAQTPVHGIRLLWDAPTPGVVQVGSYNVYRGTVKGGPYAKIGTVTVSTGRAFLDSTGVAGTAYFYVVTAVDTTGKSESGFSNEATAISPSLTVGKPVNLRVNAQ
jgi:fibronectin type 3 domain-containing protein